MNAAPGRVRGDQGLTLIEVIVASVMILLIFVPVSNFLATGDRVIANSQSNRVLVAEANSQVTTVIQGAFPPAHFPTNWASAPSWPSATTCTSDPGMCPSGTQDSIKWTAWMTGGWCVLESTHSWGNGTVSATTVPTYHVAVKVSAPEGQSGTGRALASGEFAVATGGPSTGVKVSSCPLGLS
ncbi:MAG: hypothetical protein ACYDHU_00140 [Acidimicrobiales bacterium]